jgi:hypothetical protein
VGKNGICFGTPSQKVFQGNTFRLPVPIHLDFSAIEGDEIIVEGILLFGRKSDDPSYVVHLTVDSRKNQHKGKGN